MHLSQLDWLKESVLNERCVINEVSTRFPSNRYDHVHRHHQVQSGVQGKLKVTVKTNQKSGTLTFDIPRLHGQRAREASLLPLSSSDLALHS